MKKLTVLCLCLGLLGGCRLLPVFSAQETAPQASAPVPLEVTMPPQVTDTPLPTPTCTPEPTPTSTAPVTQTCGGACFRFDAPEAWRRYDLDGGVCLYPDAGDTRHTFLLYQETENSLGLTETALDVALFLSPKKVITDMVAKALTQSGFTDFTLSPVSAKKASLNGLTCYRGATTVTVSGESFAFEGYVFLRGDSLILLIWSGDAARFAEGLNVVYDSFREIQ